MPFMSGIVDSAKRDLTAVVEWGRQKMQEGAYDEAAKYFSKALEMKPGFMQALVSRGFCYLTLGDEERAQLDFVAVINKDAGFNRNIYVLMALCCKRSGDYHTAIRYLNRCIGHFPSFKPALMARGELSLKVRDFERSRADFKQVLQDEPMHLVARRGLADSFRGVGNFREAERQYGRAINDTLQALEHHQARQESIQQRDISEADRGDISDDDLSRNQEGTTDYDDRQSDEKQGPSSSTPDEDSGRPEELLAEPEQLRAFLTELLVRRALLLRLMGKLESAGSDLLEVLELEPQDGLALFWYGKVLIEQQRHQEAFPFLQASIQHHESTAMAAHALMGALLMIRPDPDFEAAQRHLKEATRLSPASQSMRVTLWICSAAVLLNSNPRDASGALDLLDRALAALEASQDAPRPEGEAPAIVALGSSRTSGSRSARGPASGHVAGSGGAAAALLSARSRSAEEARWSATRSLVKHQQDLAQGDDLEQALQCSSFLQLVAREPQQRAAHVPSMFFQLRVTALCDLRRWEEAVADCRRALILEPGDESTQYTMHVAVGIIRSQASKFEAAVGCFTKAIRLQPVSTEARLHRAIVLACAARAQGEGASFHDTARVAQLLTDAVQDLEAVQQQAEIAGAQAPLGAAHLRAACLCSLGRPEEAWEVLCDSGKLCVGRRSHTDSRDDPSVPRQRALEAEVLVLLRRHDEAVEACSAVLALNARGQTEARLMRGWCYSEMGDEEQAFEDINAALDSDPGRVDVHEADGDLCFAHGRLPEAYSAYGKAIRRCQPPESRLAYKRAISQLAMGQLDIAQQELSRARAGTSPQMASAMRAKDGVHALQSILKEDWRHAHVRLNMMLHQGNPGGASALQVPLSNGPDGLPALFLSHELILYRGICSLYLGDVCTAIQDFATALDLVQQLAANVQQADWAYSGSKLQRMLPPEVASREGLAAFECECLYNIALCHLRDGRDPRAALDAVERLCERQEAVESLGASADSLVWFLAGICHLALGSEANEQHAKEAFGRSYSSDPAYVNDFLRRHSRSMQDQQQSAGEPSRYPSLFRPIGGCPVPVRVPLKEREACDAPPEAICCLRKMPGSSPATATRAVLETSLEEDEQTDAHLGDEGQDGQLGGEQHSIVGSSGTAGRAEGGNASFASSIGGGSRSRQLLSTLLPPLRLTVRDVVIWGRPSVGWPHVCAPEWTPPTILARLDLLRNSLPVAGGRGGA
eukprot:TRINITY_DN22760_c0_g1_i1.p1 TRINITY_DN22760_c0_g1~~TRINITY_DN22760_c0_g1_i1.p1  ORF type:complete len:1223 (+),score=266.39 TRINITY_DN22760_c0_g1_i1:158-3826(+)